MDYRISSDGFLIMVLLYIELKSRPRRVCCNQSCWIVETVHVGAHLGLNPSISSMASSISWLASMKRSRSNFLIITRYFSVGVHETQTRPCLSAVPSTKASIELGSPAR